MRKKEYFEYIFSALSWRPLIYTNDLLIERWLPGGDAPTCHASPLFNSRHLACFCRLCPWIGSPVGSNLSWIRETCLKLSLDWVLHRSIGWIVVAAAAVTKHLTLEERDIGYEWVESTTGQPYINSAHGLGYTRMLYIYAHVCPSSTKSWIDSWNAARSSKSTFLILEHQPCRLDMIESIRIHVRFLKHLLGGSNAGSNLTFLIDHSWKGTLGQNVKSWLHEIWIIIVKHGSIDRSNVYLHAYSISNSLVLKLQMQFLDFACSVSLLSTIRNQL